ncbi:MAG: ribonuclease PH [Acidobacteria bacterium]|nr:ribonuclease PH [Acidobacteriota bacterium]MCB9397516.1 ribonuclease PH [Acidobacteriota bacterium]
MRSYDRAPNQMRPLRLTPGFIGNAEGSVLIEIGRTRVICTASIEDRVPPFLKNKGTGWITAEYGMLPASTSQRNQREASKGKQTGRTVEIQRLIGRALRTCVDLDKLGEKTITVDCDVIEADGGTRTASITGGYVALALCLWKKREDFNAIPLINGVAAISLGVKEGQVVVDLDYEEDSSIDVDLNLVMTHTQQIVEIQGTAEHAPFTETQLQDMLRLGKSAIGLLIQRQKECLSQAGLTTAWLA